MCDRVIYEEVTSDQNLIKKANNLREVIEKALKGKQVYKLLGIKVKRNTYPRGVNTITSRTTPVNVLDKEYSLSELSGAQKGFFRNLNNLTKIECLRDYKEKFSVIPDEFDKDLNLCILASKKKDSLGRIVLEKVGVIFRAFTEAEEDEYREKIALKESQDLGMATSTEEDDFLFSNDF